MLARLRAEWRTLEKPRPSSSPPLAAVGTHVTDGSWGIQVWPALWVFLRHPGCPFAEHTLMQLRDLSVMAVSHGDAQVTRQWLESLGDLGNVETVHDSDRLLHRTWGVPTSSALHFLGVRSLLGVVRLATSGIMNRPPCGNRWQTAAAFLIDHHGVIRWRHLPRHAADVPDFAAAVNGNMGE